MLLKVVGFKELLSYFLISLAERFSWYIMGSDNISMELMFCSPCLKYVPASALPLIIISRQFDLCHFKVLKFKPAIHIYCEFFDFIHINVMLCARILLI